MARLNSSKSAANPSVGIAALLLAGAVVAFIFARPKPQSRETSMPAPLETPEAAREAAAKGPEGLEPRGEVFEQFGDRAKAYILLQKRLENGLSPLDPTADPRRLASHKEALAGHLREARLTARPGDIFGDAAPAIRAIILEDSKRREVAEVYAEMQEVPPQAPAAVGAEYPPNAPLASIPSLLLLKLPRLPDGLEYRFMGR